MAFKYASRGDALGFASRTKKNLDFIMRAAEAGDDVHVLTQLMNSLLGLVVFPWEKSYYDAIKTWQLSELAAEGWPKFDILKGQCLTLEDLINRLRNGVSHGRVAYSSDSRDPNEVFIVVEDLPSKKSPHGWAMRIGAQDLRRLCIRLIDSVDQVIG